MALDIGIELGRGERALEHVALELGHVDAVGGEAAQRLVERGRDVAHLEHEGREHRPVAARRPLCRPRQHHEARRRVGFVLDVLGEDVEAVDLGGEARGDRGAAAVAALGDLAGGAGGVGGDHALDAELADEVAALAERHDVALDRFDLGEPHALERQQLVADRQEPLGDDVEARDRHQVMDVGDPARHRVLDRDHAEIGLAARHRVERVLEGRARALAPRRDRPRGRRCAEFAPGSPWNTIFSGALDMGFLIDRGSRRGRAAKSTPRARLRGLPGCRRRAAPTRRWRRRCACRLRARAIARASRVAPAATAPGATKRASAARR